MLEFIQKLKKSYQTIGQQQAGDLQNDAGPNRIEQLMLAEAFIQKGQLIESNPDHALQIAVIGPTQVGKSTIVNLLLNSKAAGVSALAGYTTHPQGFGSAGLDPQQCTWLKQYFDGFMQCKQAKLNAGNYASYSLTMATNIQPGLVKDCLVWDTPDFDSIGAASYREGVLRTIALADIIIMVVSKEKYADQTVWDMLSLIQPLDKPTLIIVNKLVSASQDMVLESLASRWQQAFNQTDLVLIPLVYQESGKLENWPDNIANQITQAITQATKKSQRHNHSQYQNNYLNSHWQAWLEPVMAEYKAKEEWQKMLDAVIKESLQQYQRDYLNHPYHYETFNNAVLALLTLLEIPGIARVLAKTRRLLTWPVRKVFSLGRHPDHGKDQKNQEVVLLNQKADHLLIQLAEKVLDNIEQGVSNRLWWQEINKILRSERTRINQNFDTAADKYHHEFQHQVEETAQQLYMKLQEQPIILNSLRATRLTTDGAAVLLAIHTGGIGLQDLIITPVILSITSLLAESTLGSYVQRSEAQLKQKQLSVIKQQLFEQKIKIPLLELPNKISSAVQFNIPRQQLESIEQQLKEKKHGL